MQSVGRSRAALVAVLALVILRWWLGTTPGYPPDIGAYKRWALWAGTRGVQTLYEEGSFYDYPPLYGYILAPLGQLAAWVDPDYAAAYLADDPSQRPGYSALLSFLVKIPPLVFDILLAMLLARLAFHWGLWPSDRARRGWGPALLYLLNPAVLFLSGYWGQPDAIEIYFVMLALTLILMGKNEAGWVSAAVAVLMKPVAAPFLPLLALATLLRSGWSRLVTGGAAAAVTVLVGLMPYIVTGRAGQVAQKLLADVEIMPYTSVNAHNLWWLLGSWRPAGDAWLGPLTPKIIGLTLFGLIYLALLWWVWQRERMIAKPMVIDPVTKELAPAPPGSFMDPLRHDAHWFLAAGAVAFAFFTTSTHMHENHLYPALPFLVLMAGRGRRWVWVLAATSLALLVNMFTHDYLTGVAWLSDVGGPSGFFHPDFNRPLSRAELGVANANACLTVATCIALLVFIFRNRTTERV